MLCPAAQLSHFPGLTKFRIRNALAILGSAKKILGASKSELESAQWKPQTIQDFFAWRKEFSVQTAQEILEKHDITTCSIEDAHYPSQLRDLYDPPLCLFIRGSLDNYTTSLAVVGARKITSYGKLIIDRLIPPLANAGITIISGLAYGVDSAAHRATLATRGTTIAVLGSGIDTPSISPRQHQSLAAEIVSSSGALITEYPPGTSASRYTFPERNRIIAALSRATLIIEAGKKSGSLITATCAMNIGRDVCAIPHPIHTPLGIGPNTLLKDGAHVITTPEDIFTLLQISSQQSLPIKNTVSPKGELELLLHQLLQTKALHIDIIIDTVPHPKTEIMSTLTLMEMRGLVKNIGNMQYIAQ